MNAEFYQHPKKPIQIKKKIVVKTRVAELTGISVSYVEQLLNKKKHGTEALNRVWTAIDVLYGNNFEPITNTLKSEFSN